MVVGGLVLGMILVGHLAFQVRVGFRTGVPPGIDATAPNLPAPTLDSARTLGALTGQDTVPYVFAPNGQGVSDALVVTPGALVVVAGGHPRRYPHSDFTLLLARTNRAGYVILKFRGGTPPDTVYRPISGLEQQILELGMRRAVK